MLSVLMDTGDSSLAYGNAALLNTCSFLDLKIQMVSFGWYCSCVVKGWKERWAARGPSGGNFICRFSRGVS